MTTLVPRRRLRRLAGPLRQILVQRSAQAVSVVVLVTTLCFVMVQRLPGDMAFRVAAGRYGYDQVDAATAAVVRADLGLDRPLWQQLGDWLASVARFDLGSSVVTGADVVAELGLYLWASLQLAGSALLLAVATGAVMGVVAEHRRGGIVDQLTTVWVSVSRALPPFLLGLLLLLVFSVQLRLLPAVGHGQASNLVLPAVTMAVGLSGLFARLTRDTVAQVRDSEHVRFAATKGLRGRVLFWRHVARNAGATLVAYVGAQALILVEGVVVVESLFSWPGLGHAMVHAIFWRDVPMIQATALALAMVVVTVNLLVDVTAIVLDPRPRRREKVA